MGTFVRQEATRSGQGRPIPGTVPGMSAGAPEPDRKARKPIIADPPLRIVRFSPKALREGVEEHHLEGVTVRITSAARTVADCFKYRNKIGLDVALEALRAYRRTKRSVDDLARAAGVARVSNVMRPYLEAVLS
jgi:hypothetical protein